MDEIQIRSFPAAIMIVAAGFEPRRVEPLPAGGTAWHFDDSARAIATLYQQVKAKLRAAEAQAHRGPGR